MVHFTDSNAASQILNFVDLTVITNQQCAQTFGSIIIASTLCCATSNGQSTCNVSFSFRYSSEIHFLLCNTQNVLPPTRPPIKSPVFTVVYQLCKVYYYPLLTYLSDQNLSAIWYIFFQDHFLFQFPCLNVTFLTLINTVNFQYICLALQGDSGGPLVVL